MLGDAGDAKAVEAPRGGQLLEECFVESVGVRGVGAVRDPSDGGKPGLLGRVAKRDVGAVDLRALASRTARHMRARLPQPHRLGATAHADDQRIEVAQELPVADLLVASFRNSACSASISPSD